MARSSLPAPAGSAPARQPPATDPGQPGHFRQVARLVRAHPGLRGLDHRDPLAPGTSLFIDGWSSPAQWRQRGCQLPRVLAGRGLQVQPVSSSPVPELGGGAAGDDLAVVDDDDRPGEPFGFLDVLGGQQQAGALCGQAADTTASISPHKLRHFLFTWLKTQGIDDALIQPYSGHATRQSLEIYSRLALADVQQRYDDAIGHFPV